MRIRALKPAERRPRRGVEQNLHVFSRCRPILLVRQTRMHNTQTHEAGRPVGAPRFTFCPHRLPALLIFNCPLAPKPTHSSGWETRRPRSAFRFQLSTFSFQLSAFNFSFTRSSTRRPHSGHRSALRSRPRSEYPQPRHNATCCSISISRSRVAAPARCTRRSSDQNTASMTVSRTANTTVGVASVGIAAVASAPAPYPSDAAATVRAPSTSHSRRSPDSRCAAPSPRSARRREASSGNCLSSSRPASDAPSTYAGSLNARIGRLLNTTRHQRAHRWHSRRRTSHQSG